MKEELGLDHFEGRSWTGLHRHALMTMIALCFLQHLRLKERGKKHGGQSSRATTTAELASHSPPAGQPVPPYMDLLPTLWC
jgi:SRSO17 transposase